MFSDSMWGALQLRSRAHVIKKPRIGYVPGPRHRLAAAHVLASALRSVKEVGRVMRGAPTKYCGKYASMRGLRPLLAQYLVVLRSSHVDLH